MIKIMSEGLTKNRERARGKIDRGFRNTFNIILSLKFSPTARRVARAERYLSFD